MPKELAQFAKRQIKASFFAKFETDKQTLVPNVQHKSFNRNQTLAGPCLGLSAFRSAPNLWLCRKSLVTRRTAWPNDLSQAESSLLQAPLQPFTRKHRNRKTFPRTLSSLGKLFLSRKLFADEPTGLPDGSVWYFLSCSCYLCCLCLGSRFSPSLPSFASPELNSTPPPHDTSYLLSLIFVRAYA